MRALSLNGVEFPLKFKMKKFSRVALMCRHPMASGQLLIMLGSLLYGQITWGRLLVVFMMSLLSIIGINVEERELKRIGGP